MNILWELYLFSEQHILLWLVILNSLTFIFLSWRIRLLEQELKRYFINSLMMQLAQIREGIQKHLGK